MNNQYCKFRPEYRWSWSYILSSQSFLPLKLMVQEKVIDADPYPWPFDRRLDAARTALLIIDMQVDFCCKGGYVEAMGYSIGSTESVISPIRRVLERCRQLKMLVVHTREGHRPDLSDLPENKRWRSKQMGAEIGKDGPCGGKILVRGEPGWEIVPDLQPLFGEPIVDKPGKGAFYATDLDLILRTKGIKYLMLTGVTTDVCVSTTLREANDQGYECVVLSDCTAAIDAENYKAALNMVKMQGGIFGAVSTSQELVSKLPVRDES